MKRIQRQRTRGWTMPEGAVYVGRPSRWGNRWRIGEPFCAEVPPDRRDGKPMTRTDVIERYRSSLEVILAGNPGYLEPLRGHDLVCWCPLDQPCHADVLLELLK